MNIVTNNNNPQQGQQRQTPLSFFMQPSRCKWICLVGCLVITIHSFADTTKHLATYKLYMLDAHHNEYNQEAEQQLVHPKQQRNTSFSPSLASSNSSSVIIRNNNQMTASTTTPTSAAGSKDPNQKQNQDTNPNRTLVILMGTLRCGEAAWETLYKNVLDVNNADLALMVSENDYNDRGGGSDEDEKTINKTTRSKNILKNAFNNKTIVTTYGNYPNASLYQRAKYVWTHPEYEEWADALDTVVNTTIHPNRSFWRTEIWEKQIGDKPKQWGMLGGVFGTPSSGGIQNMVRHWLRQRLIQNDIVDKYDYFMVTRTDQYYVCPIYIASQTQMPHIDEKIYLPSSRGYGGYYDRLYVTSSKYILDSLDIISPFLNDFSKKRYPSFMYNPECLLKAGWDRKSIKVDAFAQSSFVCANPHGKDTSRFKTANNRTYQKEFDVTFKYEVEFYDSMELYKGNSTTQSKCYKNQTYFRIWKTKWGYVN